MPPVPTVGELIRDYGHEEKGVCHCCGERNLYRVVKRDGEFVACSWCDVDIVHRWKA